MAFGGRLRDGSNDNLAQALRLGDQILIFAHKLCEFIRTRRKASRKIVSIPDVVAVAADKLLDEVNWAGMAPLNLGANNLSRHRASCQCS
jgi:hypothetical protein